MAVQYHVVSPTPIHSKPNHLIDLDRKYNHPQPHHPNLTTPFSPPIPTSPSSPPILTSHPHPISISPPSPHPYHSPLLSGLGYLSLLISVFFLNKFFKEFIAFCYQRVNGEMENRSNKTKKRGRRRKGHKGK